MGPDVCFPANQRGLCGPDTPGPPKILSMFFLQRMRRIHAGPELQWSALMPPDMRGRFNADVLSQETNSGHCVALKQADRPPLA